MVTKKNLLTLLITILHEFNEEREPEKKINVSSETILYGEGSKFDSLDLVSYVIEVEERVSNELGKTVTLTDEKALSQTRSPFQNPKTLADYIYDLGE